MYLFDPEDIKKKNWRFLINNKIWSLELDILNKQELQGPYIGHSSVISNLAVFFFTWKFLHKRNVD